MTTLDDLAETLEKMQGNQVRMQANQENTKIDIATINRGIYGDPINNVPGIHERFKELLEKDKIQHDRIKSLEESKKKALWVGGGALISVEALWQLIKHKFNL